VKVVALYRAGLKVAFRFVLVLLLSLLALVALVLVSLPKGIFSANEVPRISLVLVYGDGNESNDDMLIRSLNAEIEEIDVVESVTLCTAAEAEERLARGEADAVIILPAGTLDALIYGGHATITVRATDPLIGTVVYSVTDRAIETLDEVQGYALAYEQDSRGHFKSAEEHYEAVSAFNMMLFGEAIARLRNVESPSSVSPYFAQILTLLLFLMVSIASFFVSVIAARQYAQGYVRHLYTRGVRFRHLFAAQLLLSASISLVLGLVLAVVLSFVGEGFSFFALLVSSVLLSLVLTSLYLMFSGFCQRPQAATTRALMGCLALMFFLLFAGGGFYPTGLMQTDMRLFNPAWLANQLAAWTLGDSLNPLQLILFALPFTLGGAVSWLEWRRSL
jgi:hypothetical protein